MFGVLRSNVAIRKHHGSDAKGQKISIAEVSVLTISKMRIMAQEKKEEEIHDED